jgi:hypothetical protein
MFGTWEVYAAVPLSKSIISGLVTEADIDFNVPVLATVAGKVDTRSSNGYFNIVDPDCDGRLVGQANCYESQIVEILVRDGQLVDEGQILAMCVPKRHLKSIEGQKTIKTKKSELEKLAQKTSEAQAKHKSIIADTETEKSEILAAAEQEARNIKKSALALMRAAKDERHEVDAFRERTSTECEHLRFTARDEVERIKAEGQHKADTLVAEIIAKAEAQQAIILENARSTLAEADQNKKAAEEEASHTLEIAKREAHAAIAKAQAEAKAQRKAAEQNAAKLKLEATVKHLYALQASGELPEITERPTMRRLYLALGELLAEAQGFAAPETAAQMANQNRIDEIKAMNEALAKEIRDTETNNDWPDVVKERHIEMLLDMTDAKGGSIVKNAVDDG